MKLEIIEDDIKKAKLKFSPTYAFLKVPLNSKQEDIDRLVNLSIFIIQSIPDVMTTLMGRFYTKKGKYITQLHNDSLTYYSKVFEEE